jgi:hypothetical protein
MSLLVFMSHASADKPVARRIRDALEDKGLRVWIDEVDIRVGHSIASKVANGLDSADVLCLLVSKGALASKWVMREYETFLHKSMTDERPILPCRLDKSEMPTLLSGVKYANFSESFDAGMGALLGAVKIAEDIHERETIRDYVSRAKAIIEKMLAAHAPGARREILHELIAGIENQNATENQERLLGELAGTFNRDDDSEFEGAIQIGDFDVWYVYGDVQTALEELSASCSA